MRIISYILLFQTKYKLYFWTLPSSNLTLWKLYTTTILPMYSTKMYKLFTMQQEDILFSEYMHMPKVQHILGQVQKKSFG